MRFNNEIELEKATLPLIEKHFEYWSWQVAHSYSVCDFMGITYNDLVVSIEYKLRDWKRALDQCRYHLLCSDFAYVLMPKRKSSDNILRFIKENRLPIGVIFFDKKPEIIQKPKPHRMKWKPTYEAVKRQIKFFQIHDRKSYIISPERIKEFNRIEQEIRNSL